MTPDQRTKLMAYWWPDAAKNQAWPNTRAKRLEVLSQVVGRQLASANDLNNTSDIDAVKARLLFLADNIDGAAEDGRPDLGEMRRLKWQITQNSPALVAKFLHDRFTWAVWLRNTYPRLAGKPIKRSPANVIAQYRAADPHAPDLDDLNRAELTQLRNTLARAASKPRTAAVSSDDQPQPAAIADNQPF